MVSKVVYMLSKILQMTVESRDLSQGKKKNYIAQNGQSRHFQ